MVCQFLCSFGTVRVMFAGLRREYEKRGAFVAIERKKKKIDNRSILIEARNRWGDGLCQSRVESNLHMTRSESEADDPLENHASTGWHSIYKQVII